jgi:hypothetical protein
MEATRLQGRVRKGWKLDGDSIDAADQGDLQVWKGNQCLSAQGREWRGQLTAAPAVSLASAGRRADRAGPAQYCAKEAQSYGCVLPVSDDREVVPACSGVTSRACS